MKFVDRNSVPEPKSLSGEKAEHARQEVRDYLATDVKSRSQHRLRPRVEIYRARDVRDGLLNLFDNACAYCESPLNLTSSPDIEHFRPKSNAGNHRKSTRLEYYSWLAYEWDNLLLACQVCNRSKSNIFPVKGHRGDPGAPVHALRKSEDYSLIDPCYDHPHEHLKFFYDGNVEPKTKRGGETIAVLDLNRELLVSAREKAFTQAVGRLKTSPEDVTLLPTGSNLLAERFVLAGMPYKGAFTNMLQHHLDIEGVVFDTFISRDLRDMGMETRRRFFNNRLTASNFPAESSADDYVYETASIPEASTPETKDTGTLRNRPPSLKNMAFADRQIIDVSIRNFKALENIEFSLPAQIEDPGLTPCMIILGENATGKSTVLEAIALTLLGAPEISALDGKTGTEKITPTALAHKTDFGTKDEAYSGDISVHIGFLGRENGPQLIGAPESKTFARPAAQSKLVLAYGPRRYFGSKTQRWLRASHHRVRSLFDPLFTIPDPTIWLRDCDDDTFNAVSRALREILLMPEDGLFVREGDDIVIEANGGTTPFKKLSVGYKSVITMSVDIMRELLVHYDNLETASAVVLIDEIETHLHPRWKMQIMDSLRKAMPHVQFIVTTHDPLCLRGMYDGEVFVLRRTENGDIEQLEELPNVRGMRAEQLLTSEFFGLGSTDPETDVKLSRYTDLVARKETLTPGEEDELADLQVYLKKYMVIGDTLKQQAEIEALELASENIPTEISTATIPQDRKKLVKDILENLEDVDFMTFDDE